MYITRIVLTNYRSFFKPTEISLQPGMNLLLGENNSGKSTILEALSLNTVSYQPHLSTETKPSPFSTLQSTQRLSMEVCVDKHDLWMYLGQQVVLPLPSANGTTSFDAPVYMNEAESIRFAFEWSGTGTESAIEFFHIINNKRYGINANGHATMCYQLPPGGELSPGTVVNYTDRKVLDSHWKTFQLRHYKFKAERLSPHRSHYGESTTLFADASNLAECLNNLQSQQLHLFQEYNQHIKHIFPSIHHVGATVVGNPVGVEVRIWLAPLDIRRFDLTIPLSQAGTGIGQVLAILYVAMSSPEPITIGIDEPNSFLHPKAVRALLQILNALPVKHQYIVTTHSPEVIRAADPSAIAVVTNIDGVSRVQGLDPSNIEHIKTGLASIGARLSDVYGADKILWVEGETEEIVFPKIAQRLADVDSVGVTMLKVNATGDFERNRGAKPRLVFEAYKRLSSSNALIPPAIGFIFDREDRSQQEIDDLTRESNGSVVFTDRRCYENYLLHPDAIAKVLSDYSPDAIDAERIRAWIAEHGNTSLYIKGLVDTAKGQDLLVSADWLKRVNAPKLLADLFLALSENTVEYRKTKHSVELTEFIIDYGFDRLGSVSELIRKCLNQDSTRSF
jgi:predicted ATPase